MAMPTYYPAMSPAMYHTDYAGQALAQGMARPANTPVGLLGNILSGYLLGQRQKQMMGMMAQSQMHAQGIMQDQTLDPQTKVQRLMQLGMMTGNPAYHQMAQMALSAARLNMQQQQIDPLALELNRISSGKDLTRGQLGGRQDKNTDAFQRPNVQMPSESGGNPQFLTPQQLQDQNQKNTNPQVKLAGWTQPQEDAGSDASGRNEEYLSSLSPLLQEKIKGLTDYTLDPSQIASLRNNQRGTLFAIAKKYDPSFDMINYNIRLGAKKDFTTGEAARNVRSLGTISHHLSFLNQLYPAMQNGNYPLVNKLVNMWNVQTGHPEVTDFRVAEMMARNELGRLMNGIQATEVENKLAQTIMNQDSSPAQISDAIKTMGQLVQGRFDALKDQYDSAMGEGSSGKFLPFRKAAEGLKGFVGGGNEGDMISVTSPEGKTGRIPRSSLNAALKRGFKANGR